MNAKTLLNPDLIRQRTAEARNTSGTSGTSGATAVTATDRRNEEIAQAFNAGNWGCQKRSVKALVEAITGVKIVEPETTNLCPIVVGALYHYENETVLVRCLDSDGDGLFLTAEFEPANKEGSRYIDSDESPATRPAATEAQVEEFLEAVGLA